MRSLSSTRSAFLVLPLLLLPSWGLEVLDRVVASVNESVITQTQLTRKIQDLNRLFSQNEGPTKGRVPPPDVVQREALNRLIDEELLLQRSEGTLRVASAEKVAERTIDEYIEDLIAQIGKDEFEAQLARENQTAAEFRSLLVAERTRQILVQQSTLSWIDEIMLTPVSTGQIDSYIDEHPSIRTEAGALKIRLILIRVPQGATESEQSALRRKADRVLNRARIGEPFEDLVKEFSEHEQTRDSGGLLSLDSPTSPFPEFAPLFDLEQSQIYPEPIKIQAGWCIVRIEDRESLYKQARRAMAQEEVQRGLSELREKATITYDPDLFTLPPAGLEPVPAQPQPLEPTTPESN
jgi:parvulin-like peptidyl-prolyl isomerase